MTNSVEALTACIKLLRMVKKAKSEIAAKRYYHSLRTIDDIQGNHLRNVQDFEFAQVIKNSLPSMKMEVKNLVLNEMRDWLSKIRDDSKVVGSLAIQLAHTRDERIRNRADQSRVTYSHATNAILEQFANDEWECKIHESNQSNLPTHSIL